MSQHQDELSEPVAPQSGVIPDSHVIEINASARWRDTLLAIAGLAIVIQIASLFTPAYILPGWGDIWQSLLNLRPADLTLTIIRVFVSMLFSFVAGSLLGIAAYSVIGVDRYVVPIVRVLMAVPAVSWVIITILWFRNPETRIFFVLVTVSAPIFMLDVLDGLRSVDRDLRDMLRSFRPTRRQYYMKLMLPSVVPVVLTSWKINLSLAIRVVTFAELVGAVSGIGFALNQAKNLFRISDVFALTIVLVVWLIAMQGIVLWFEKRLLRWRD